MVGGLLSDPIGTVQQYVNGLNDAAGQGLGLLAQSGPPVGTPTPQAQQARNSLVDTLGPMMIGATVWHGSPHVFNAFDAGKIGSGEGNQAYGHGLYFAENPAVAKEYADNLGTRVYKDGQLVQGPGVDTSANLATPSPRYSANSDTNDYLTMHLGDTAAARSSLLSTIRDMRSSNAPEAVKDYQSALAELRNVRGGIQAQNEGALYKVDLPDEHIAKMLDWDGPVSSELSTSPMTGEQFYQSLVQSEGPDGAAQMLRSIGIPGIRYLDGGSRGAGAGTSNYVVFPGNEGLLQILERNGQPVR